MLCLSITFPFGYVICSDARHVRVRSVFHLQSKARVLRHIQDLGPQHLITRICSAVHLASALDDFSAARKQAPLKVIVDRVSTVARVDGRSRAVIIDFIDHLRRFSIDTRCAGGQKARAQGQRFVSSNHQDTTRTQTFADVSEHIALNDVIKIRERDCMPRFPRKSLRSTATFLPRTIGCDRRHSSIF